MTRLHDIMTREVVSVSPDVSIREAMGLLSSRHISGVPVVNGRDIVGVITSTDLMAFAAELSDATATRNDQAVLDDLPGAESSLKAVTSPSCGMKLARTPRCVSPTSPDRRWTCSTCTR